MVDGIDQAEGKPLACRENVKMEGLMEEKSRLIDNLAYQIRTLSNAIIGFSDLLSGEEMDPTQQEYISEIRQAGRGLSSLVDDVLDLARMQAGKLKPVFSECKTGNLLEKIEYHVTRAARQKGLTFEIQTDADLPARLHTDGERLSKCILNLASNAIRYTSEGGVMLRVTVERQSSLPAIRFDVIDTGIGIDPEKLKSIFNPSRRLEGAHVGMLTNLNLGLHLSGGLAVTHQMVELLGGRIEVVSEPGAGSVFSILIPAGVDLETQPDLACPDGEPDEMPATEPMEPTLRPQCLGHVLLVEDEESNRTVLTLMLEGLGLQVSSAGDGMEAFEKGLSGEYDLILMDIHLPLIDGCEVLRRLREQGLSVPVIALSAGVMDDAEEARIRCLFDCYLVKPVDSRQLTEVLERHLPMTVGQAKTAELSDLGCDRLN